MGVGELVAGSADEYVALAVRLATDDAWRARVQQRIRDSVPKLYGRAEAVTAWLLAREHTRYLQRRGGVAAQSGSSRAATK